MKTPHPATRFYLAGLLALLGLTHSAMRAADAPATAAPAATPPAATTPTATTTAPATDATAAAKPNTAIIPLIQPRTDARHAKFVEIAKKGDIDVLFLGDSITDFWGTTGKDVFAQYYGNMKTANFGISADRTQHVLWRLQNGEGQGFSPKVVVLMIGTNNTGPEKTPAAPLRNTTAEATEGVYAVVAELRKDFPDAKILLLAIFPRFDNTISNGQIVEINHALAKLNDLTHVFYLDIGDKFLNDDKTAFKPGVFGRDNLHPAAPGYVIWAEAIKEPLALLLKP